MAHFTFSCERNRISAVPQAEIYTNWTIKHHILTNNKNSILNSTVEFFNYTLNTRVLQETNLYENPNLITFIYLIRFCVLNNESVHFCASVHYAASICRARAFHFEKI